MNISLLKPWLVVFLFSFSFLGFAQQQADSLVDKQSEAIDTIYDEPEEAISAQQQDEGIDQKNEFLEKDTRFRFNAESLLRGLLGMIVLIGISWMFSANKKAISWRLVGIGLFIQMLLAFSILKISAVQYFFEIIGRMFVLVLDFTKAGTEFLFAGFLDTETYGYIFAFQVLPTIIFFSALTSLLFYLGVIQKVVYFLAWIMSRALKLSGAESLSVAGNIFLGQTESPLMIKAYLPHMNKSEI
ncbi:MAG: Na+ dependent nucleoside transporter N-terminal domain-containing protein, partial [Bacteroidota bacterium]